MALDETNGDDFSSTGLGPIFAGNAAYEFEYFLGTQGGVTGALADLVYKIPVPRGEAT